MRVLQINGVASSGSTGRIVQELAGALRQAGEECLVASGRDGGRSADITIGSRADLLAHVAVSRLFDAHSRGSQGATRRFIDEVADVAPDLVHLHNAHGYYANLAELLIGLEEFGVPVVWTLHDCWSFTGHCTHFDAIGCERWLSGCGSCPQIGAYPSSWGMDRSAANFRLKNEIYSQLSSLTLVTPSRWLGQLVSRSMLRSTPLHVIENDPDEEVFRPRGRMASRKALGLPTDQYIVLAAASFWDRRKGLADLSELSRHLRNDEELVVVGQVRQVDQLPREVVHRAKTSSAKSMAELYSAADVFVNPTMEDTYPSVNLEALACGTPVITYASGGSGEAIERGEGVVLHDRTPSALRSAIDELREAGALKNDTVGLLRPAYGGRMVDRYLGLYQSILGG